MEARHLIAAAVVLLLWDPVAATTGRCAITSSGADVSMHSLDSRKLLFKGITPVVTRVAGSTPSMTITGYSHVPVVLEDEYHVNVTMADCLFEDPTSSATRQSCSAASMAAGLAIAATSRSFTGGLVGLGLAGLGLGAKAQEPPLCQPVVEVTITAPAPEEAQCVPHLGIGVTTARIPEAAESRAEAHCGDGVDGDVAFPHGDMKPIATVGECADGAFCIRGVPDGQGAMLKDDHTVRVIVQSESYGPLAAFESAPWHANNGLTSFTGSHVQYVDYDRAKMAKFMSGRAPASHMVVGAGQVADTVYNLKNELVGARSPRGATTSGAHYSSTDAAGHYALAKVPTEAHWIMQSLCSAHLEQRHQWGEGVGVEDNLFITNEEWAALAPDTDFVGLSAHAIDLATKTMYAIGAFGLSGFEKIVEVNAGHKDYVAFAVSGYNGAFHSAKTLEARNRAYKRPGHGPYVWPENIVPSRLYIGRKGYDAAGRKDSTSFLARNGLAHGKMYGFAVPEAGFKARDAWHKEHYNGERLAGGFYPIAWMWNGTVRNFEHDGAWQFQDPPVNGAGMQFWTGAGKDMAGKKMEHVTPDPHGASAYWQGSTAGYIGRYEFPGLRTTLQAIEKNSQVFPDHVDASYVVLQGHTPVVDLIDLRGKGHTSSSVGHQTHHCDGANCKETLGDPDGLEAFAAPDGKTYLLIQEDGMNHHGERMFLTEARFDRGRRASEKVYKFVAQSGGKSSARHNAPCAVGVPAGTWAGSGAHEFSGSTDLSGLLRQEGGVFALRASDSGHERREHERMVGINNKTILVGVQAHNLISGAVRKNRADRGGQWLLYTPQI